MPPKFKAGDEVLVPSNLVKRPHVYALTPTKVQSVGQRSVTVDDRDGGVVSIGVRLVHPRDIGFLVLRIGNFDREQALLDPLAKSVLQFLRLLLEDEAVMALSVRTMAELEQWWASSEHRVSHVVIIGHGSDTALLFASQVVDAQQMASRLAAVSRTRQKAFFSLACKTGMTAFARPFSKSPICSVFIAPREDLHGAVGSQFLHYLLTEHLLEGLEITYAFNRAANRVVGGRQLRRWTNGTWHAAP